MVMVVQQPEALHQFDQTNGDGEGCGEGLYRCASFIGEGVHYIQQQVDHLQTTCQGSYTHTHTYMGVLLKITFFQKSSTKHEILKGPVT